MNYFKQQLKQSPVNIGFFPLTTKLKSNARSLQVILSFELLVTCSAHKLALITVCEFMFGQGTCVAEDFMAQVTFQGALSLARGHLPGFHCLWARLTKFLSVIKLRV